MRDEPTWQAWQSASRDARAAWIQEAAARVGGTVSGDVIEVRGVQLVLVPGGPVNLGWDGATTALHAEDRAGWNDRSDFDGSFETFLRMYLGPARSTSLAPFLIERAAVHVSHFDIDPHGRDPEAAVRRALKRDGFRLPSNDEWEVAMRAGATTMFAWGDTWPEGIPWRGETSFTGHMQANALGIQPRTDPYESEIVAEKQWLRGGDGGSAICGGRPYPEAWYSFALAFQLPRSMWADFVAETFETGVFVRRVLSLDQRAQRSEVKKTSGKRAKAARKPAAKPKPAKKAKKAKKAKEK